MDRDLIYSKVDHTCLNQTATWEEIKELCDNALAYKTASVCIPPSYVKQAAEYFNGKMKVCTVIGFPNGYNTTKVKEFETRQAIAEGANEIDMVINLGFLKMKRWDFIEEEICTIKSVCKELTLKVIIETCFLTEAEKIKMCEVVTNAGADFIKTSTGFAAGGATFEDIALFAKHVGKDVKIKAAGGISSFEDAEKFIALGAERLGTSRIVKLAMNEKGTGY